MILPMSPRCSTTETIYYDFEYYFDQTELLPPIDTQAFFIGTEPLPTGLIVIVGLAPRKYRIVLEWHDYFSGDESIQYAAVTGPFDVLSGENTVLSDSVSFEWYYNERYGVYY